MPSRSAIRHGQKSLPATSSSPTCCSSGWSRSPNGCAPTALWRRHPIWRRCAVTSNAPARTASRRSRSYSCTATTIRSMSGRSQRSPAAWGSGKSRSVMKSRRWSSWSDAATRRWSTLTCRRSCGAMWPVWRRSFLLHLPLEGGGRPAPAGRGGGDSDAASAARPLHPTPDRPRRSDPPPPGEGGKLSADAATRLMFMMSSGGLTAAELFQGKDAILSGPAGGVVGMAETGREAGFQHLIGFDMGGTSTDVSHYDGEYERAFETEVAGVRMRAPMMLIHTVAAGGGSILHFDGARFRVGPDSAGANPGPKCYRRGGPLAVTDANVMVGKLIPDFFPKIFGPRQDQPLDAEAVRAAFADLAREVNRGLGGERSAEDIADGFIRIAVENMANAIKKISIQRGYDVTRYALNCFGGAGGQHACLVADALGMTTVLIHPFSSLMSAYGMGLADIRATRQQAVEASFDDGA